MPRFALRRPRGFITLAGIAALTALFVGAQAPDLKPTPIDQATAQIVTTLLERGHLSKPEINDEVATRWAKNFISSFDPLKYYFLKADNDEFMAQATTLDDKVKEGNIDFAKLVFDRFLMRSDERLVDALEILKTEPDFTVDESITDDPELVDYPATAEEARERLRKLLKLDLLRMKVSDVKDVDALKRLTIRYKDLNRYYKLFNTSDLLERYLSAMTTAIDPHSQYMQATTLEDLLGQQLHLSLEGIGASLMVEDGFPVVKEVVAGGAADRDGRLQAEDKIVGLETETGEKEDFYGKKLSDVVRKIRGPAGTKVKIMVQQAGSEEIKLYELTREKIELAEQQAKGQIIEAESGDGKSIKVGIIGLPSFYGDTMAVMNDEPDAVSATKDCRKLLEDFKEKGVDVAVVDLRMNGGGLLSEAISLSGLFIDTGPVVQVREAQSVKQLDDDEEGTSWDGPMAVLIDHTSASASEIFAGVIRDYSRGLIIGDSSTYGKGTVQSIVDLNERLNLRGGKNIPDLGALKLTVQQFYRPNGESTQARGVKPHIHIPSFLDNQDIGEDKNETALKFDQVAPVPHDQYNRVTDDLVATLGKRSETRRKESPKFQEQQAAIARYLARRARHEISLSEASFRAEMAANEVDEDEAKAAEEDESGKPKKKRSERIVWESNFYNDEVIDIIADYYRLGGNILTAGPVHAEQPGRLPQVP